MFRYEQPFVFTTIRHFYPREAALERFKALQNMPFLNHWTAFWFNIAIYCIWQFFYFQFVVVRKKVKIELVSSPPAKANADELLTEPRYPSSATWRFRAGHRPTSYTTMSRNKGAIGKTIAKFPPAMREPGFMLLQFLYTILTTVSSSSASANNRMAPRHQADASFYSYYRAASRVLDLLRLFESQVRSAVSTTLFPLVKTLTRTAVPLAPTKAQLSCWRLPH